MNPRYNWQENNVLARCPDCDAVTSFDTKGHSGTVLGTVIINQIHIYSGTRYSRILWQALRCAVCNRGAMAKIHDEGNSQTAVLEEFIPQAVEKAALPASCPKGHYKGISRSGAGCISRSVSKCFGHAALGVGQNS